MAGWGVKIKPRPNKKKRAHKFNRLTGEPIHAERQPMRFKQLNKYLALRRIYGARA